MFARIIIFVISAAVIQHVIRVMYNMGYFKVIFFHAPGACMRVKGVDYGAEDFAILSTGLVYMSSGLVKNDGKGRILLYNMNTTDRPAYDMKLDGMEPEKLTPHGISVWNDPDSGIVSLFVINHHKSGPERIEQFEHDGKKTTITLKHIKTITDRYFINLNGIVATGPDSFYATNVSPSHSAFINFLYVLFNWRAGNVIYYNGVRSRNVEGSVLMANGINISPDGKYLYVNEFGLGRLKIYERFPDNSLHINRTLVLDTGIDNIDVSHDDGSLWLGCHPCGFQKLIAPLMPGAFMFTGSQVLKIVMDKNGSPKEVIEVYQDEGRRISGSSAAGFFKGRLLIGTVEDGALICDARTVPHW